MIMSEGKTRRSELELENPVDIEIFTLCDAAADYQGRLNILGVFDTIFAPQMPASHPLSP